MAAGMQELFQPCDFDPDFDDVNIFMDDIEVLHDGAKPGSLSDHGRIAGLVKYCTNEDVRQAVRDLRTEGYTDDAGNHFHWVDVTWPMAREYMVHLFGGTTTEERAVELLLDPDGEGLQQDSRLPVYLKKVLRAYKDAGSPLDLESKSPMDLMRFRMCLSGNLWPEMAGASCDAPRQWCAAMQDRNKALKVRHLVGYSKEQDAVCWRASKEMGLGGRYWETPAERRLRQAGGKA